MQRILTDPAFGYAYAPIEDTRRSGFGDPTIGLLWRFFQRPKQSLVLGLGVRLGIAEQNDPDNLLDFPVGDGSTDLRAQIEYFADPGANFDLRLLLDRKVQLADRVSVRIPPARPTVGPRQ